MFQPPLEAEGKATRRRTATIVGATAVVGAVIIGAVLYLNHHGSGQGASDQSTGLSPAFRAGSPEFEGYRQSVQVEAGEPDGSENLLGQVVVVAKGVLHNKGDRTLTGVEVRAVVYDFDQKVIGDRVSTPVPKFRPSLGPNQSMPVQIRVDNVPAGANPAAAEIVIQGIRFE